MPKSIRTNSNTQNIPTLATFKAGDSVLCPSLSFTSFVLTADPYGKRDLLALTHDGSNIYYDDKGYFVPAHDTETGDYQPSLFQDTPANRQAIATLYNGRFATQDSQRKVIDTTEADDNIVVTMSSHDLNHIAGDICGAANALHDVGYLLGLIYYGKIEGEAVKSMARLSHDATSTWAEILYAQLDIINEPLAMTGYSKVGAE
ncbi:MULTISPECIES: hypothetical protein [unclassified Psychrobacter]|uniref:hypothetical protein n=1 Tax=unclassified Psychrobacter TaxID=196806 RepID=UPI00191B1B71|nr:MULTISPECIES: hypothetical protein [unclassified Psychrobacter]|tara:strand:+ start:86 stop:694 length:609 start_codon:yes stop_codon:yes gene_type:complete